MHSQYICQFSRMVKSQVCQQSFYNCSLLTQSLPTSSSWAPHWAVHSQQLIDVLHISHMWDIQPGINFASQELLKFNLHPAHCLRLACQYNLLDWISTSVQSLLTSPLEWYTTDSKDSLDFDLYMIIVSAKESIATERRCLGNYPPFPSNEVCWFQSQYWPYSNYIFLVFLKAQL